MRRRTLLCVSFALAVHGAAFLALDRFWFLAATHRPSVDRDRAIELVPEEPDPVALPVTLAAAVPPPQIAPALKPEKRTEPKSEPRLERKPESKPEVQPIAVIQPAPVPPASEAAAVVASVTPVAASSSGFTTAPLSSAAASTAENSSSVANARPSTVPVFSPSTYPSDQKPAYPENARRRKQEGIVVLAVEVSAKGRALQVEVETSSGFPLLDKAALDDVRHGRFKPALLDGVPTASHVLVPVRFQLKD